MRRERVRTYHEILNELCSDKKERRAIVVLLLLILLTGWYVGIYSPIQERIEAADTTDLEDAIAMEQVKSARIKSMQAEIQENKDADAPVVPSYNNFKEELEELNRIHGQTYDFLLHLMSRR